MIFKVYQKKSVSLILFGEFIYLKEDLAEEDSI